MVVDGLDMARGTYEEEVTTAATIAIQEKTPLVSMSHRPHRLHQAM
jgi:hypothetical protein